MVSDIINYLLNINPFLPMGVAFLILFLIGEFGKFLKYCFTWFLQRKLTPVQFKIFVTWARFSSIGVFVLFFVSALVLLMQDSWRGWFSVFSIVIFTLLILIVPFFITLTNLKEEKNIREGRGSWDEQEIKRRWLMYCAIEMISPDNDEGRELFARWQGVDLEVLNCLLRRLK